MLVSFFVFCNLIRCPLPPAKWCDSRVRRKTQYDPTVSVNCWCLIIACWPKVYKNHMTALHWHQTLYTVNRRTWCWGTDQTQYRWRVLNLPPRTWARWHHGWLATLSVPENTKTCELAQPFFFKIHFLTLSFFIHVFIMLDEWHNIS